MKNIIKKRDRFFARFGRPVEVLHNFKTGYTKALVQPMRYHNKVYVDMPQTETGRRDNGAYLYIGHPAVTMEGNVVRSRVKYEGMVYGVKRSYTVFCDGEPLYVWAVLYRVISEGDYERY